MREDMGKVLVERPRLRPWKYKPGPGKGYRKRVDRCLDAGYPTPAREGMKVRYGHRTKHFNEHLGPLRRFLDSNVGRPWDKVYAEICKHVDRGNVVQKHILTHLFDYVVVHTVLIGGVPCRGDGGWRRYGTPLRASHSRHQWYVCPKSGLLRRSRYVPHQYDKPPVPPRVVRLNNRQACVCRDGRWELISVDLVARAPDGVPAYDEILRRHIDEPRKCEEVVEYHHRNKYAVTRRTLSRKELLGMPIPVEWLPRR